MIKEKSKVVDEEEQLEHRSPGEAGHANEQDDKQGVKQMKAGTYTQTLRRFLCLQLYILIHVQTVQE